MAAGDRGTCRVWDASTGALLLTMQFLSGVTSVAWGRDWLRELQRREAFAMGGHPRLGAGSRVLALDEGLVKMMLADHAGGVPAAL